jgi:hypothetical protein
VIGANEEKEEFHTLFGRLKGNRQKYFKCFRMGISKLENFKEVLSTDNKTNNTQWRRNIRTEERLTLTLR